jgi:hypothetical protein
MYDIDSSLQPLSNSTTQINTLLPDQEPGQVLYDLNKATATKATNKTQSDSLTT